MVEWIYLVDGKCPFNPSHELEKWNHKLDKENDKKLFYCHRCDLILQKKTNNDKKGMKRLFRFETRVGKRNARESNKKIKLHIKSLQTLAFFPILKNINKRRG